MAVVWPVGAALVAERRVCLVWESPDNFRYGSETVVYGLLILASLLISYHNVKFNYIRTFFVEYVQWRQFLFCTINITGSPFPFMPRLGCSRRLPVQEPISNLSKEQISLCRKPGELFCIWFRVLIALLLIQYSPAWHGLDTTDHCIFELSITNDPRLSKIFVHLRVKGPPYSLKNH